MAFYYGNRLEPWGTRIERGNGMNSFGIIGDGSWGLALSKRLVASGHEVTIAGLAEKKRTPKG